MMRSLFSGISGLKSHQTRMDVIGNNIANVNTTGFKSSRTTFADMISQHLTGSSAPTVTRGGINPKQIGLGTAVASIDLIFTDGSPQSTGKNTDLALTGNGLFVVKNGNQTYYTRDGAFAFDGEGNYVLPGSGMFVQGWMGKDGVVDTAAAVGNITVQAGKVMEAKSTSLVNYNNNLNAEIAVITALTDGTHSSTQDPTVTTLVASTDVPVTLTLSDGTQVVQTEGTYTIGESIPLTTTITVYDSLGSTHDIPVYFKKVADEINATDTQTSVTQLDRWIVTLSKEGLTDASGKQLYNTGKTMTITQEDGTTATVPIYTTDSKDSSGDSLSPVSVSTGNYAYVIGNGDGQINSVTDADGNTLYDTGKTIEYVETGSTVTTKYPVYTTTNTGSLSPVYANTGDTVKYITALTKSEGVIEASGSTYVLKDASGNQLYRTGNKITDTDGTVYNVYSTDSSKGSAVTVSSTSSNKNYVLDTNITSDTKTGTVQANYDYVTGTNTSTYTHIEDDGTLTTVTMPVVTLQFTNTGAYYAPASSSAVTTLTYTNGAQGTDGTYLKDNTGATIATQQNVTLSFIDLTQYTGSNTIVGTSNGNPSGVLSSIEFDSSGVVTGVYTNGIRQAEAQVAVAQFTNAAGLTKTGSSLYQESNNSGVPNIKTASDLGVEITPSALEMSNVDVANEFADMIITQRGFQSNSKIITVGDEMLETVINMKR